MSAADFVRAIPEGLWGVLLGSLLAFGATYVATRRQLLHDAEQRERDRKMSLRRDVFLEVADGLAGTTDYFFKFANADVPLVELGASTQKYGWLNKLYVIASLETIEAFSEANGQYGAAVFDLMRERLRVEDLKHKIDGVGQQIELCVSEQRHVGELAAALANQVRTAQVMDEQKLTAQRWEDSVEERTRLDREQSEYLDAKLRIQKSLLERAVQHTLAYQSKLRKALSAIRNELDFPIHSGELERMSRRIEIDVQNRFKELLVAIESDSE